MGLLNCVHITTIFFLACLGVYGVKLLLPREFASLHGLKNRERNGDEYLTHYEPTIVVNVRRFSQRIRFVEAKLARAENIIIFSKLPFR